MIDILLATYNGEKYISEQIDSLINQTYQNWTLIVHDDGSSDNTIKILKKYVLKYPKKIILIEDAIKTGGAKNNFSHLSSFSTSQYIMFCDQDDVWLNDRIELFYKTMLESEKGYGNIPIVVFSDLTVVDDKLNVVNNSMIKYQRLNPEIAKSFEMLKCQNVITGCAMMVNKKALDFSMPIPKDALMHDWWIGLITAKYGKNIFLNTATILYRQHVNNAIGFRKVTIFTIFTKIFSLKIYKDFKKMSLMLKDFDFNINLIHFLICKIKVTLFRFFKLKYNAEEKQ